MGIAIVFLLGIANFALHRAVLESGHAIVRTMRASDSIFTPRITLALEFGLLLAAMLLVAYGHSGWGLTYGIYTSLNALMAWLILTRRI